MGRSLGPWILIALLAAGPAAAQSQGLEVRDGTLGSGPLEVGPGTDPLGNQATYLITPELGEQHGSNLFHSFASFGIGENETATFTGPALLGIGVRVGADDLDRFRVDRDVRPAPSRSSAGVS